MLDTTTQPCAVQVLDQQAQDLEDTMQQLVQKGRDLHEQQQKAGLQRQPASLASEQPEAGADASMEDGRLQASKHEYKELQQQADNKAKMVRYLSDQLQQRSEEVWEAQQLLAETSNGAASKSMKERAAR